jgi:hypothetical protein
MGNSRDVSGRRPWRKSLLHCHRVPEPIYKHRSCLKPLNHLADIECVIDALIQSLARGALTDLATLTNISDTPLCTWWSILLFNLCWLPSRWSHATGGTLPEEKEA